MSRITRSSVPAPAETLVPTSCRFSRPTGRTPGGLFPCLSLAGGVKGMAGLGRTKISLPAQFSAAFSFPRKFAVCLSSSTRSSGVMFFGNGPYMLLPNTDASASLIYTPLIVNPSESVYWTIFGSNSMVQVSDKVLCLGFVDGGLNPRTSIVIGGYQIEDNLLQFDLAASRLGFSSSLFFRQTTCANFNFTSNA
ncbi:hypothetical protein C3L33_14945, partial [Rhododendron williamsianum]